MRRLLLLLLALSVVEGSGVEASAANDAGTTALPVLTMPTSARGAVLGAGYAAVSDDLFSLQYNPAGLSGIHRQEASFMFMKGVEDTGLEFAGYGQPLPITGILNSGYASAAVGLLYSQNGSIQVNRTNPDGSLMDSRTLSAGNDIVLSAGYAERLTEERMPNGGTWQAFGGVTLQYIRTTLAEKYTANAEAANAGMIIKLSDPQLAFGVSVANLGPPVRYVSVDDPLPLTYRLGMAYTFTTIFDQNFMLVGGGEFGAGTQAWKRTLAVEWNAHKEYAFRVGYQFDHEDELGVSAGFGVTEANFALDYAWVPFSALSDQHRITLTYRFGDPAQTRVKENRRVIKDIDRPAAPREQRQEKKQQQQKKAGPSLLIPGWE